MDAHHRVTLRNPKSNLRLSSDETFEDHQDRLGFLTALSVLLANQKRDKKLDGSYMGTVRRNISGGRALFVNSASSPDVMAGSHDMLKVELGQFVPGFAQTASSTPAE